MILLINIITALASISATLSILTFRKRNCRHKPVVSLLAWLLLNAAAIHALFVLLQGYQRPAPAFTAMLIMLVLAATLINHRGNVSYLLPRQL